MDQHGVGHFGNGTALSSNGNGSKLWKSFLKALLPVLIAVVWNISQCRPTIASFFMNATAVEEYSKPKTGTAACSVRMAMCRALRCRNEMAFEGGLDLAV